MSTPTTIGVVTTSFPRFDGDHAGSFVFELARALVARGHYIEVIAPADCEPPCDKRPLRLKGMRVQRVRYARPDALQTLFYGAGVPDNLARAPWRAALAPSAFAALALAVRRLGGRWDAVLSHWLIPSALAVGLARRRGLPHLAFAHSGDVHLLRRLPGHSVLLDFLDRSCEQLGCVSVDLRDELLELARRQTRARLEPRCSVLPMGLPEEAFLMPISADERRSKRTCAGLGNGFSVLFVGRLVPIKGVDVLLAAASLLPGVEIVIAGDGPEREALRQAATAACAVVRFVGQVTPLERNELLLACDALAFPSRVLPDGRHEGFPLIVLEALAAGCPVVATRTGGVPEVIIDGETGCLVPPQDAVALAAALQSLQQDPALATRLSAAGRNTARQYRWSTLAARVEARLCY